MDRKEGTEIVNPGIIFFAGKEVISLKMFIKFLKYFSILVVIAAIIFFIFVPAYIDKSKNNVTLKVVDPQKANWYDSIPFIADLHCDALLWDRNNLKKHIYGHVDIPRMQEANMAFQVFTIVSKTPKGINIESNEVYFLDSAGKELIAVEGSVKKVDCINYYSKDSIRYVFKNGYPAIDKQNEYYYYQVLTEGNIELLAKKFKYISSTKDALTGELTKDFVDGAVVLYVYGNDKIQVFHPNKKFILSLLKDKEPAINNFIETNKINLKKSVDLISLFNYFNSLK